MKESIKQPWPRSAKITVWVLCVVFSFVTFLAFAYVPPCEECMRRDAESRTTWPIPTDYESIANRLLERLRDQKVKHPEDFVVPSKEEETDVDLIIRVGFDPAYGF